jgi:hypothetical protein
MSTAVHEIGHGVAFKAAGYKIGRIKINLWLGGGACHVSHESAVFADEADVRAACLGAVGGWVAEDHYRRQNGMMDASRMAASSDFATFDQWASPIGLSESVAIEEAHALVLENWDEIMEHALVLAERGSLDGSVIS